MNQRVSPRVEELPLSAAAENIDCREDLREFLDKLIADYRQNAEDWENRELGAFLAAMVAWLGDMDGYYTNRGEPIPNEPSWKLFAHMILAAKVYE